MNAALPNTEIIGALSITEVFDFFDGPKLFVCENLAGQCFLGYWVGADQVGESYWILPISQGRRLAVRSGAISLRDAFSRPELGYLLECKVHFEDGSTEASRLIPSQLDPSLLPAAEEIIGLQTETLPVRMASLDLPRKAVANLRDVLGLHFVFPGTREDGPTKMVGKILVSVQDFLDALGQKIMSVATMRGAIAPDILFRTETRLVQAAGASFGLEILAARQVDLFGNSLISDSVKEFLEIIEIGNDVERLRDRLLDIKPRAASKYRVFLTSLIASESSFRADWASPDPSRNRSVSLDLITAAGALKTVEQVTSEAGETRVVTARFVGVELPRRSFTLEVDGDDEPYRGKIAASAMGMAEHATLNHPYRVTIRETLEVTASGEERSRFEVEKIEELE